MIFIINNSIFAIINNKKWLCFNFYVVYLYLYSGMTHKHYIYIYCDPRKKGIFKYDGIDIIFNYEPFYVGMGYGYRYKRHVTNYEIQLNYNTIKNGKIKHIIEENFDPLKYVIFYKDSEKNNEKVSGF